MKRARLAGVFCAIVAVAAACAGPDPRQLTVTTTTIDVTGDLSAKLVAVGVISGSSYGWYGDSPISLPWTLASSDPKSNRLTISWTNTGCVLPRSILVQETSKAVRITLSGVDAARGPIRTCASSGLGVSFPVELNETLDSRSLIHG